MKYILVFFFLISTTLCVGQSNLKYNRSHIIFPGCETSEDISKCYDNKVLHFIDSNLTTEVSKKLIRLSKKDTLTIFSRLYFNEKGDLLQNLSHFSSSVDSLKKGLDYLELKFPKVMPVLDETDKGVADYKSTISGFKIDRENKKLIPIENYQPEVVPISIIEKVPLYQGCSDKLKGKDAIKCMNDKMKIHVGQNFNTDIGNTVGLDPGIKRIFVFFKIDKEGEITSIKARAPHPALEKEAIRVISLIPKLSAPGIQRGKPVIVPFYMPIVFVLEGMPMTKKELRRLKRKQRN